MAAVKRIRQLPLHISDSLTSFATNKHTDTSCVVPWTFEEVWTDCISINVMVSEVGETGEEFSSILYHPIKEGLFAYEKKKAPEQYTVAEQHQQCK